MLGGTAGQLAVGRWISDGLTLPQYWGRTGVLVLLLAVGLWSITPKETPGGAPGKPSGGILATYKVVFSNPQSYLCGLAAGLLFVPTTVGDMVWGARFFQADKMFSFADAVLAISMVPLGWVCGCPLLGRLVGVASGAAMIPYTIIKEVNPGEVKGSATGAINFLTFGVTAAIGPIFAGRFGKTLGARAVDAAAHFRHAGLFWI